MFTENIMAMLIMGLVFFAITQKLLLGIKEVQKLTLLYEEIEKSRL